MGICHVPPSLEPSCRVAPVSSHDSGCYISSHVAITTLSGQTENIRFPTVMGEGSTALLSIGHPIFLPISLLLEMLLFAVPPIVHVYRWHDKSL